MVRGGPPQRPHHAHNSTPAEASLQRHHVVDVLLRAGQDPVGLDRGQPLVVGRRGHGLVAARLVEELAAQLFPGGRGRLRLVSEREGTPARVIGGQQASPDGAEADGADAEAEETADEEERTEEDLLGVEIEITPAGKDPKRLSLLSGGEKSMTALAFLFAVFLARPCPFYILDEVEAALDDLNLDRFLALLRRYSGRAQFIVITHQKRTMEAADWLYGVSMGEDGVSKVLSRRLPSETAEVAEVA
jgi:chromosome segregation protein